MHDELGGVNPADRVRRCAGKRCDKSFQGSMPAGWGAAKVVLAGGAWSRLFCGNLGVELPQLKLLASVMRTGPVEGAPDRAAGADNFAFRKRFDGGYTIARRNANVAELNPDSFRLFFDFLPALVTQWHELRLRVGRSFLEEWRIPRRWALDAETPFETVRTLDPAPRSPFSMKGKGTS